METPTSVQPAPRKRHWPRFSLRALLVIVTLVAIWLAIVTKRAKDQAAAIKEIESFGGLVRFDYEFDSAGKDINNDEPAAPRWLRSLVGEDYFRTVVQLDLSIAIHRMGNSKPIDFTRRALAAIDRLPGLRTLEMGDNPELDDAGLEHLSHLSQLRVLSFIRPG